MNINERKGTKPFATIARAELGGRASLTRQDGSCPEFFVVATSCGRYTWATVREGYHVLKACDAVPGVAS